jgi:hypothetical protein
VRLLLDRGAKLEGQPVLSAAASAGDEGVMRMLLDRGVERKPLPGDLALHSDCPACIDLVLQFAAREDLNRVLVNMSRIGEPAFVKTLLDHGADANVVASNTRANERTSAIPLTKPPSVPDARSAIAKSLPLMQHADVVFLKKAGCVSCHNNSLFLMTASIARKKGLRIDESLAQSQLKAISAYIESWRERVLQDIRIPGGVDTTAYILASLAAVDYAPDPATDALAIYLKRHQAADGKWRIGAHRPPVESSDFENTAMALRGLEAYAPQPQRALYAESIRRGADWLARSQPESNEDRVFQLLGLGWSHGNKDTVRKAMNELIRLQRADGGWAQIPALGSDAYATGQALTALAEAGGLKASDPVYQRGIRFLLETQLADGSWYVRSRAYPVQPYFDSEFPHDRDQFISAAATNWATIALTLAQ